MKNLTILLLTIIVTLIACDKDSTPLDCTNTTSVFTIDLNANNCSIDIENTLNTNSNYTESINGTQRTISVNNIPNHKVGAFPNSGNPNTISAVSETFTVTTNPSKTNSSTSGQGFSTAVLFSGVVVEPFTAEFFEGTNGKNTDWNITTLQSTRDLGLDCNNAHVQPNGRYHYHGKPSSYLATLNVDGSQMVKVGYAADGFPIYYKYGYDTDGTTIKTYKSGYILKTEERSGDGNSAPDGCPDGYYFNDYEFDSSQSALDECNGTTGKTPDANSEYYYVITDDFPSVPLCFYGTPDQSFHH